MSTSAKVPKRIKSAAFVNVAVKEARNWIPQCVDASLNGSEYVLAPAAEPTATPTTQKEAAAMLAADVYTAVLPVAVRETIAELRRRGWGPWPDADAGVPWKGIWQRGETYKRGAIVGWSGSSWIARADTTEMPHDKAGSWEIFARRGSDRK